MGWWGAGIVAAFVVGWFAGRHRGNMRARKAKHTLNYMYLTVWRDMTADPAMRFDHSHTVRLVENSFDNPYDWATDVREGDQA